MLTRVTPETAAAAHLADERRSSAHRMLLLTQPEVEWSRRIAMIRAAREFVALSTYYIGHDARGFEVLDALTAARRRGVTVLLGIDAFGQFLGSQTYSRAQRADLQARLAAIGDGVRFYRAPTRLQRFFGAGQHVKIQLSEAGEALHGSSNLSARSFDAGQWREVGFSLWGDAAAPAFDALATLFPGVLGAAQRARLVAATATPDAQAGSKAHDPIALEYWWHDPNRPSVPFGPVAGVHNPLSQRLVEAIDASRVSVRATSFYFKPCASLGAAFERAARRGVAVEVFHSHRAALEESDMPWMAAAADYPRWFAAGITIHESRRGEHSKLLLIDDAELAIGSYNFEHAAHDRLAELMVFVRDAEVLTQARALFDGLRIDPDYQRIDTAAYAREPWALRTRTVLFSPLRRWF